MAEPKEPPKKEGSSGVTVSEVSAHGWPASDLGSVAGQDVMVEIHGEAKPLTSQLLRS